MADLIPREAAIELIVNKQRELCPVGRFSRNAVYGSDREKFDYWQEIIDEIERLPVVDAVPVVRCRDCKEWEPCNEGECGTCNLIGGLWEPHEYCSEGERRDDNGSDDCRFAIDHQKPNVVQEEK